MFRLFPVAAAGNATRVDDLFFCLLALTGLVLLSVFALILVFCIRYRRQSRAERGDRIKKSWHWEISWTAATLVAFVALFIWGADLYAGMFHPPPGALEIFVVGKQWMWKVEHPDGQREIDELHIPVDRPVRLIIASQDVIHSFYIPAFRIKRDAVPGRYEMIWFRATKTGEFALRCGEFCGTDHAHMVGRVVVMKPADYERWLETQRPSGSLAAQGEKLFRSYGCSGCHTPGGAIRAPDLAGVYGRPVPLADGRIVRADDAYIRDSILMPRKDVVAGFEPVMPSFAGQIDESDLVKLIAYVKSLGESGSSKP